MSLFDFCLKLWVLRRWLQGRPKLLARSDIFVSRNSLKMIICVDSLASSYWGCEAKIWGKNNFFSEVYSLFLFLCCGVATCPGVHCLCTIGPTEEAPATCHPELRNKLVLKTDGLMIFWRDKFVILLKLCSAWKQMTGISDTPPPPVCSPMKWATWLLLRARFVQTNDMEELVAFPIMQPICQSELEAKSRMPSWSVWPWRTCEFMWRVALQILLTQTLLWSRCTLLPLNWKLELCSLN